MKTRNILTLGIAVLCVAALATTGCMVTPNNNQNVYTRDGAQIAIGYLVEPNKEVYLEAYVFDRRDPMHGRWVNVARDLANRPFVPRSNHRAEDTAGRPWDGPELYQWTTFYVVPRECWEQIGGQYRARLRVRSNGTTLPNGQLYAFKEGFFQDHDWENTTMNDIGEWQDADGIITIWADR